MKGLGGFKLPAPPKIAKPKKVKVGKVKLMKNAVKVKQPKLGGLK